MVTTPYATTEQLAEFLNPDAELPDDADRLLSHASDRVDDYVLAAFTLDTITGLPRDADVAEALATAACAQVEFWLEVGEEHDVDGVRGAISVPGASFSSPPTLAPRARSALMRAGLMSVGRVGL